MIFFTEGIFLTELNFLKGDANIYFKLITFFEKKEDFRKSYIFFLKNIYFFQLSFAKFEYKLQSYQFIKQFKRCIYSL